MEHCLIEQIIYTVIYISFTVGKS